MSNFDKDLKITSQEAGKVLTLDADKKIVATNINTENVAEKSYVDTQDNEIKTRLQAVETATGILAEQVVSINGEVV